MTTLAEIMASPEALEASANDFVAFRSSQPHSVEDMNKGIQTDAQFIALVNKCGTNPDIDYKKFCEIGEDD